MSGTQSLGLRRGINSEYNGIKGKLNVAQTVYSRRNNAVYVPFRSRFISSPFPLPHLLDPGYICGVEVEVLSACPNISGFFEYHLTTMLKRRVEGSSYEIIWLKRLSARDYFISFSRSLGESVLAIQHLVCLDLGTVRYSESGGNQQTNTSRGRMAGMWKAFPILFSTLGPTITFSFVPPPPVASVGLVPRRDSVSLRP
ncbi:hypothetical protein K438DRAFT_1765540 [Mycena galopus ATCC 62051]|nr:hypothetical protein K438DRAFT_1765540 [Mycena galopus ATCC 62051]